MVRNPATTWVRLGVCILVAASVFVGVTFCPASAAERVFRAGAAVSNITPPMGELLVGANVALGRKYTLWPAPNYVHCTDPDDNIQLTDGQITTAYFWTQTSTVGWSSAAYVVITIDLGNLQPISGGSFNTAAGVAGITWPAAIQILTSDDGKTYHNAGDLVELVVDVAEVFIAWRSHAALSHRFHADAAALEARLRQTPLRDETLRAPLPDRFSEVRDALDAGSLQVDRSFQAVLPLSPTHEQLFRLQADLWRAMGHAPLVATASQPWDPLDPFEPPAAQSASAVEVHTMRGEYRAAAVNLYNATEEPISVQVSFDGLPGPDLICLSTAGVRADPRWLSGLVAHGYRLPCGFDADAPGDAAAAAMITKHPQITRLRPREHDWNDVLSLEN